MNAREARDIARNHERLNESRMSGIWIEEINNLIDQDARRGRFNTRLFISSISIPVLERVIQHFQLNDFIVEFHERNPEVRIQYPDLMVGHIEVSWNEC